MILKLQLNNKQSIIVPKDTHNSILIESLKDGTSLSDNDWIITALTVKGYKRDREGFWWKSPHFPLWEMDSEIDLRI